MEKLTRQGYDALIAKGTSVVVLSAAWAGPAQALLGELDTLGKRLAAGVRLGVVDADAEPALFAALGQALPTLRVYRDGALLLTLVGLVKGDALVSRLQIVGVLRDSGVSGAEWPLAELSARSASVAKSARAELADEIGKRSAAAARGLPLQPVIEAAHTALRDIPALVDELQTFLRADHPTFKRLGVLAALYYGASPGDVLPDDLPGGYGFLDDWLVLNAARWLYVREPDAGEAQQLSLFAAKIWMSLPAPTIAPLAHFVAHMENERALLQGKPEAVLMMLLAELTARPAPMQFPMPAAPSSPSVSVSPHASGAIWGDGRAQYLRFEGGGLVGKTAGGKIVGGPQ